MPPRPSRAPRANWRSPDPGAPLVAEFCVAELALVLGMSTDAGQAYLGDAIEIRYRLPGLWGGGAGRAGAGVEGPQDRERDPTLPCRRCRVHRPPPRPGRARLHVRPDRTGRRNARALFDPDEAEPPAPRQPPRPDTSTSTSTRSAPAALSGSMVASTSPTPSTSRPPSPPAPSSWLPTGARRPSPYAGPWRSDCSPDSSRRPRAGDLRPPRRLEPRRRSSYVENTGRGSPSNSSRQWCADSNARLTIQPVLRPQRAPDRPTSDNARHRGLPPGRSIDWPTRPASVPHPHTEAVTVQRPSSHIIGRPLGTDRQCRPCRRRAG